METIEKIKLPLFCLLSCIFFFLSPGNFASANSNNSTLINNQWVFHSEVSGVKIFYQISSCEGKSVVYLRFNNANARPVQISWQEYFSTKQVPEEKKGHTSKKVLNLSPGETSEDDCSQIKIKECVSQAYQVFPAYKADIITFDLKEISVTLPAE